ncbi:bifunctional glutamate--cysteine ligase GshA/glutathione synthetase GshB [Algivirga pacifica]|uniref:Glutamate--cysteine ligase n=1 Tax=Algivirga pacifica TaxID=1162670 RepID=A0ABP9D6L1_9BACT
MKNTLKASMLVEGNFGLEKENLRVNSDGTLAFSPHPAALGDKLTHPYITTDFSESQVEMITPVQDTIEEAVGFLHTLHNIVEESLENEELLWPQSMPPILPIDEETIPIANFGEQGKELEEYRQYLSKVYGKRKQLVSGIHFNISFPEELLALLYQEKKSEEVSYEQFREGIYMKAAANYMKNHWFVIALLGGSPAIHASYSQYVCKSKTAHTEKGCVSPLASSFRIGKCGYRNEREFILDYSSYERYKESLQELITHKVINSEKENYSALRIKENPNNGAISHLEVRHIDLNPFEASGVSAIDLRIVHLVMLYGLLEEDKEFNEQAQRRAHEYQLTAADRGRDPQAMVSVAGEKEQSFQEVLADFAERFLKELPQDLPIAYQEAIDHLKGLLEQPEQRLASKITASFDTPEMFIQWHLEQSRKHREEAEGKNYNFYGKKDLELSTQLLMKEAVKRGVKVELLDRSENFITLSKGEKKEYVVQATKTSLDSYSHILMMENKVVTKKVLKAAGIQAPEGNEFTDAQKAKDFFGLVKGKAIVIKPKSTNFGLGISILKENNSREDYEKAVEMAFEHDNTILTEEFVSGREFRIFVINDEVVGILHRVPANVVGDGEHTIAQLIDRKNEDPLRGKGYKTPLEKIAKGDAEALFLKTQGLTFEDIPAKDQVIYLRENSNISTGGDSIDYTDDIHPSYKAIAVEAAKAMGVKITGLDMMIDNIQAPAQPNNYSIIELNFNPAIHIHCHPYQGKNRHLDAKILDALGF